MALRKARVTPVTFEKRIDAEEHAKQKIGMDGHGVTATTYPGTSERQVRDRYITGYIGEYVFEDWCERLPVSPSIRDMNAEDLRSPYDFEVNGLAVDVKTTAAEHPEIAVGRHERVDEPDVYVKVELRKERSEGRIRGFVLTEDLLADRNRAKVFGKDGYRVGVTDEDYRDPSEFATLL